MDLKVIPLDVVESISESGRRRAKYNLGTGKNIKLHEDTKNALLAMKVQNGFISMSDVVDSLIAVVALTQYLLPENEDIMESMMTREMTREKRGIARAVRIGAKTYYTIALAAKQFKCSEITIKRRVNNVSKFAWSHYNYVDELSMLDKKYEFCDMYRKMN